MEEKLRFRDAEIYRLKESTKSIINSVGSSRKQSRASSQHHLDLEDLKEMIEEKEHEISVSLLLMTSSKITACNSCFLGAEAPFGCLEEKLTTTTEQ